LRLTTLNHPWPVHPDEAEFTVALTAPQPYPVHPPGYPLWFAAGWIAHRIGFGPYASYELWSMLASCAGPAFFFLGLRSSAGDSLAWMAGLALGVNPVWWFEGVTALNYAAANCLAIVLVSMCWRAWMTDNPKASLQAAVLLVVASGIRLDLALWFAPLVAWSRRSSRRLALAVLLISSIAMWGLVAGILYGGRNPTGVSHTLQILWSTSVFSRGLIDGLVRNAVKLGVYLTWGLGAGAVVAVWAARRISVGHAPAGAKRFLLLWIGPVLAFQLLVHITEIGHALWYLAPIYGLIALALSTLRSRGVAVAILSLVSAASIAQFYLYPWSADVRGWRRLVNAKVAFASASGLRQIDQRDRIHRPNNYWTVPTSQAP